MDISKEYIKMCNCPEIQKKEHDGHGDWYWDNRFDQEFINANVFVPPKSKGMTWLPRQDQIQEMINVHYQKCLKILYDFSLTVSWSINSLEQLWLAFYMFEKHKKVWDGEKWVKK